MCVCAALDGWKRVCSKTKIGDHMIVRDGATLYCSEVGKNASSVQTVFTSVMQWANVQICPVLTTGSWAPQDKETHLSNNRSVVITLESQYRSRTINIRGELELSPLLRQHCWPFTPAVSVSPAADTNANAERQEEENVRKINYAYQWETWGDKGQGEDRFSLLPEE